MKLITIFSLTLAVCCCQTTLLMAQQRVGDFIESRSNNEDQRGAERYLQYYPEHGQFVCVNGKNRYTRALYGGYTDYRVETSDVPIFAVFKKGKHRNIRFEVDGVPVDNVAWCKAAYGDGCRTYWLRDKRWEQDGAPQELTLQVLALREEEGAIFRFQTSNKQAPRRVKAIVSDIANKKIRRNGDMGADPYGVFEPSPSREHLVESEQVSKTEWQESFVVVKLNEVVKMNHGEALHLWQKTMEENRLLAGRITFSTPDEYINTLGSALVMAADGDWDGQTWLHGCIGWRMPLAGWRAGYLGDVLGWPSRARSHFDAYAKSQVTEVPPIYPHPTQDAKLNMARAEKRWGTQMYSNGYICRNPERNNQMHHYDMNLNYVDELLWHFQYDADTAYMRKMWPVLKAHLAWEKRNYDPDGDHLYDAYCCIWASDALYYSGGAVTHSSAYNYRGNYLAARIATLIGEDATPYEQEAEAIRKAMNERLWLKEEGHWVEYQDLLGLQRKHERAALWSVYTPIDCGVGSGEQNYRATCYVDTVIPHIPVVTADGRSYGSTVSTSNWLPYSWSINNVAAAEVMHTALAFFEAGRSEAAYALMKANIMDQMYLGNSPANFGQLSFYDAARGECYRDFGDCIGISARTLLQGLFGIVPNALDGKLILRPGFPADWDSASVHTPYVDYAFRRVGKKAIYQITQRMAQPLQVVVRQHLGKGTYRDSYGTAETTQTIEVDMPVVEDEAVRCERQKDTHTVNRSALLPQDVKERKTQKVNLQPYFNAKVSDIFRQQYLSPRSPFTTLQLPVQGIGEWCHPTLTADVNDSIFRTAIRGGEVNIADLPFASPSEGKNIIYTSLFDNYPDSVVLPLKGKAKHVCLLMAGSTNHMQSRMVNGLVTVTYADGTRDSMQLVNPDNWCPIEQDYYVDDRAFTVAKPRPLRFCLGKNEEVEGAMRPLTDRDLGARLGINEVYGRPLPGGAGQLLTLPLKSEKKLRSLTLCTLSNDVVIGVMAITLVK